MILDLVIIGAGPYGLSLAAHLATTGLQYRIFGTPMKSWRRNMPKGMFLKSEGFASNLYDPRGAFPLRHYCEEKNLPYADIGLPVPIETFIDYGLEFQRRFVPSLEECDIAQVRGAQDGFELETAEGELVRARWVVVATGLTHFESVPSVLKGLPHERLTHSCEHRDLEAFAGRKVVVVGAGASALDIAALLHQSGAQVELVARGSKIGYHTYTQEPRPLWEKLRNPRSGLGLGWRSRLATDAPQLFHLMPEEFRLRVVRTHLGPAPGWFIRAKTEGKFPMHLSTEIAGIETHGDELRMALTQANGSRSELMADHVIAATGYVVSLSKLGFLCAALREQIRSVEDTPVLSRRFETSVPGLYMVGIASANSFGPLTRFAYGAGFTARTLSKHLIAAQLRPSKTSRPQAAPVGLAAD
jgi:thioredoxin reductase